LDVTKHFSWSEPYFIAPRDIPLQDFSSSNSGSMKDLLGVEGTNYNNLSF
jgi:hypothetical protein